MKTIRVVAAVIKAVNEQGKEIIFATQRGYGDMKGGWEFPGGKIEQGETHKRHSNEKYRKNLMPKSKLEVLLIQSNMIILPSICRWIAFWQKLSQEIWC